MKEMIEKWNLQLFADEGEAGAESSEGADEEAKEDDKSSEESKESEKKYSDKEVNEIVEKKYAKWKAEEAKRVSEAERLANMSAEEKKAEELKTLQEKLAKLEAEQVKTELGKQASILLKESDIDATQDILDFVVGSDAESTKANIEKFKSIIESQVKAREISKGTGKTPDKFGNGGEKLTEIQKKLAKYKI